MESIFLVKGLGAAGYIILIASRNAALSYFAVFMATWWVPSSTNASSCSFWLFPIMVAEYILSYVSVNCFYVEKILNGRLLSANTMWVSGVDHLLSFIHRSEFLFRSWVSNNIEGSYKRSVSLAMVISLWVLVLTRINHNWKKSVQWKYKWSGKLQRGQCLHATGSSVRWLFCSIVPGTSPGTRWVMVKNYFLFGLMNLDTCFRPGPDVHCDWNYGFRNLPCLAQARKRATQPRGKRRNHWKSARNSRHTKWEEWTLCNCWRGQKRKGR